MKTCWGALLPVLLLAGCALFDGGSTGERSDLDRHRALWERQGLDSYSYDLTVSCFCAFTGPVRVDVVADTVAEVTPLLTLPPGPPSPEVLAFVSLTIDDLFGVVQEALNQRAAVLNVTYDATFGFPTRIDIDYIKNAVDDEVLYQAENLHFIRID